MINRHAKYVYVLKKPNTVVVEINVCHYDYWNFIKLMSIHLNVIFQWHSFLDTTCQHINLKSDEIKFLGKYEWLIFFKTTSTGQRVLFWYLALLIVEAIDHWKCVVKVSILFSLLFILFFRQCQNRKTSINDIFVIPFLK